MPEHTTWDSFKAEGSALIEKLKQIVHEGNVRRVRVRRGTDVIAVFPLTAGVVGVALAPVAAAIGALIALVKDCTLEVERVQENETASRQQEVNSRQASAAS